jgi:ABC-type Fe3+/spermidine/putrescine transport system ATPase subunit
LEVRSNLPSIILKNIAKFICRDINLKIDDRELLVLLGPNGAGKSTLLNIIAGFIDYKGSVIMDNLPVDGIPSYKRGIGYLSQSLNLFPHLSVMENVAYGLKVSRQYGLKDIESRVSELFHLMNIKHLSSRFPKNLSGGERQRVALARTLAPFPKVLLLDEPLNSIDMQTSKYLRMEFKQLQTKLGITTLYVTHDLNEAEEMADRIAVMEEGCIEQVDNPETIFFTPKSGTVSDFVGSPNILDCDYCHNLGKGIFEVGCGGLTIIVPHDGKTIKRIALLPRDIYISDTLPPGPKVNRFKGTITAVEPVKEMIKIEVRVGKNILVSEIPRQIFEEMDLRSGNKVYIIFKLRRIKVYEGKYL